MRPMPVKFGVGVTSNEKLPEELAAGYRYEQVAEHHNYHVTADNWAWPLKYPPITDRLVIDGFSPNLNKSLHIGHLRNLAIANSLNKMLPDAKFVALLGATLGVKLDALDGWRYWTGYLKYNPTEYFDVTLPDDVVKTHPQKLEAGLPPAELVPEVWDGPLGEVIVKRSDGRPLYAYYDLAFKEYVNPTHYITGHEQKEHFASLGLDKKHLPMGLVLGDDNKKLKSRTGDAIPASEVLKMIMDRLHSRASEGEERLGELDIQAKLAWNILAWNFLHTTREKNLKFEVESWTRPDQGGLYISYTYARALKALNSSPHCLKKLYKEQMAKQLFQETDLSLLGFAEQYNFYLNEAMSRLDPAPIANFAFDLARLIGKAYETEKIRFGRWAFVQSFQHATWRLEMCLANLGMFNVVEV